TERCTQHHAPKHHAPKHHAPSTMHPAPCTRHLVLCLFPSANLDTYGCAHESKLFADLIDEKPLVGKVESCGDVRKEHERWRSHTDMLDVHHANMTTHQADRWCGRGYCLDELVQQRCRHGPAPDFSDLVDCFDHLRRALARQC